MIREIIAIKKLVQPVLNLTKEVRELNYNITAGRYHITMLEEKFPKVLKVLNKAEGGNNVILPIKKFLIWRLVKLAY